MVVVWHWQVGWADRGFSQFLGAYAILRKATVSFIISVRPPASNKSDVSELIFIKFDIGRLFGTLSRKFRFR
jgi:hypothetical protein